MKKIFCLSALLLAVMCMVAVGCKKKSEGGCICLIEGEKETFSSSEMNEMEVSSCSELESYINYELENHNDIVCKSR